MKEGRFQDRIAKGLSWCLFLIIFSFLKSWPWPVNYTVVHRLHIIVRADLVYLTLWLFGKRYHRCIKKAGLETGSCHSCDDEALAANPFGPDAAAKNLREVHIDYKLYVPVLFKSKNRNAGKSLIGSFFVISAFFVGNFLNDFEPTQCFSQPSNMGREAGFCGQAEREVFNDFSLAPFVSGKPRTGMNFPAHKKIRPISTRKGASKIPAGAGATSHKTRKAQAMAQAHFKTLEGTNTDGEVIKIIEGELLTRSDKVVIRLTPIVDDGANINSNEFTHKAEVRASYGEFIDSGVAWTKRNSDGHLYMSVSLNDPAVNMTLWPNDENQGDWIARANNIRSAA